MNLPERVEPSLLKDIQTLFHFNIAGQGGGEFTIEVADEKITVIEGLEGAPKCKIQSDNENFIGVVTGRSNPVMAILMGKIKISNQAELMKYAKMFGLM